jgi:hypothetical protein
VETVAALCEEGGTTLTIEALKNHALQPDQRLRLEIEARTGEHKVEMEKARSQQQLEELLGKSTLLPQNSSEGGTNGQIPPPTPKADNPLKKTTKRRVGERAPSRDPIGEMQGTTASGTCTFKGIIEISSAQMNEAGISRVECPQCATTRSLNTKGSMIKFPSHPKRKTSARSTEERWIMQGTAWVVSKK